MWITPMSWMPENANDNLNEPLADSTKCRYNDRDGHTKTFTPMVIRFHKAFSQVVAHWPRQMIKKLLYDHGRQDLCHHNLHRDRTRSDCCLAISFAWGAMLWHGDRTMCRHSLPGAFWGECQMKGKVHLLSGRNKTKLKGSTPPMRNECWKAPNSPLLWHTQTGSSTYLLTLNIHIFPQWWQEGKCTHTWRRDSKGYYIIAPWKMIIRVGTFNGGHLNHGWLNSSGVALQTHRRQFGRKCMCLIENALWMDSAEVQFL